MTRGETLRNRPRGCPPQSSGGRCPAHGWRASKHADALSTSTSRCQRPTIWSPTGSFSRVNPHGAFAAGYPVRLKGYMNGTRSKMEWAGLPPGPEALEGAGVRGPGRDRHLGRQEQLVAVERLAHLLAELRPHEVSLQVVDRAPLAGVQDHAHERRLDPVGALARAVVVPGGHVRRVDDLVEFVRVAPVDLRLLDVGAELPRIGGPRALVSPRPPGPRRRTRGRRSSPRASRARRLRRRRGSPGGASIDIGSRASGPARTWSRIAASRTVRVIGPL